MGQRRSVLGFDNCPNQEGTETSETMDPPVFASTGFDNCPNQEGTETRLIES